MSFDQGNNGGYTLNSLGSRSIVVIRQAGWQANDILTVYKIFKMATSILKHVKAA